MVLLERMALAITFYTDQLHKIDEDLIVIDQARSKLVQHKQRLMEARKCLEKACESIEAFDGLNTPGPTNPEEKLQ